jgi:zinc metalloprotease ZmpA
MKMKKPVSNRAIWLSAVLTLSGCNAVSPSVESAVIEDETSAEAQSALQRAVQHASAQGLVSDAVKLSNRGAMVERDGQEHVRFNRTIRGLRVLGGDLVIHSDRTGKYAGVSQALEANDMADGSARLLSLGGVLSQADALSIGVNRFEGTVEGVPEAELIVNAHDRKPTLAYEVVVRGVGVEEQESIMHFIVDARSGELQEAFDEVQTVSADGSGKSYYGGTVSLTTDLVGGVYSLKDPARGGTSTVDMKNRTSGAGTKLTDTDNVWGSGALADKVTVAVDAQYGTSTTWDYFKNVHGRNGISNDGRGSTNRVHYGNKYANAFWSDSCFCMTYGDGDGVNFGPLVSLDVAGHEMSHGVTSRTAGLIYSRESGGLNEATSDIFGSMAEFYANNASDPGDYLIGEKLAIKGGAFRFMHEPFLDKKSPNCYSSTLGSLNVHYSSGVANHFFFLLAQGSNGTPTSPTCNNSSVAGIGRAAAEKIWYRALTVYMTSSTNYAAARVATLKAATDLFGAQSTQYNAVVSAWDAVSVK